MRILLNTFILTFTLAAFAQEPVFNIESEIAPCGGKGKLIFSGLQSGVKYKISMNNGVSYSSVEADAEGKIVKEGLAGRYDLIMKNDFGRATAKGYIPSEGSLPTYTLEQSPSECGAPGKITINGLNPNETYRISTNNGESYKHLSADANGAAFIEVRSGRFDVLVANDCGFSKSEITVAKEGSKPDFTVETEPSACDALGKLILTNLEPSTSYQLSINDGESFEFISTGGDGTIKKGVKGGNYRMIIKTSCGTAEGEATVISEGNAPEFTTSIEMENPASKKGTIVFSGLEALKLYQVSINSGESYSFITSDENGDIRKEVMLGSYKAIVKNKCGSSSATVIVKSN